METSLNQENLKYFILLEILHSVIRLFFISMSPSRKLKNILFQLKIILELIDNLKTCGINSYLELKVGYALTKNN